VPASRIHDRADDSELAGFFSVARDLLCVADRTGRLLRVNPAWTRATEWTEDELLAQPLEAFVHPEDRTATRDALAADADAGQPVALEHRFRHRDGSYLSLAWRLSPAGDTGKIYGVAHDVTASRRADEALRESEERYRTLFDQSPHGVFLYDPALRITECNSNFVELLQSSREALIGLNMNELRDKRLLPAILRSLRGETAAIEGTYQATTSKVRLFISMRVAPLRDAAGRVVAGMGVVEDVTRRITAQQAIARSEARFRELIERTPDAILVHRDGKVIYVNPATVAVLGYERAEELVGSPVTLVVHQDDQRMVAERIGHMLATGEAVELREERIMRRDRTTLIAEVVALPIEFDGAAAILVIARDVTERRRMQSQLLRTDRLASVGTLAAGVAHEINNPLAYVTANLELAARALPALLARAEPGEAGAPADLAARVREIEEMVRVARDGTDRVRRIVHDLKTFSRADDEQPGPVDLRRVLDAAANMAWNEVRQRARLVKDYGEVQPARGSEWRLAQVFLNLLLNAAQAIPEGQAQRHEIRVRTMGAPGGRVAVEVADTGSGIPPELLDRIFDPFFTTKPVGVGTGLGLSVCHGIVTAQGGSITVQSELGRGTVVRVELPGENAVAAPADAPDVPLQPAGARSRVLVVDDEPALAHALRTALADEHEVVVAVSGRKAQELLARDAGFDLILCDLIMPNVTGMDLYEAAPEELRGRFVFMTGGAFTARAQKFLSHVPNLCLEKPFDLAAVNAALRERGRRG
jgi:PAS domain S-box-containing protein